MNAQTKTKAHAKVKNPVKKKKNTKEASGSSVRSKVITVTPEMAHKFLTQNADCQRRPLRSAIEKYAKDMEAGLWEVNGQGIIESDVGTILDGQNRLYACIKANCSFDTVYTKGVEERTFFTLDTGSRRTAPQVLLMMGEKMTASLAGSIALFANWKRHQSISNRAGSSVGEILFLLDKYPEFRNTNLICNYRDIAVFPSVARVVHFIAAATDKELADKFILGLRGRRTSKNDGARYKYPEELRDLILREALQGRRRLRHDQLALTIKAWNMFLKNKRNGKVEFPTGEPLPPFLNLKNNHFPDRIHT